LSHTRHLDGPRQSTAFQFSSQCCVRLPATQNLPRLSGDGPRGAQPVNAERIGRPKPRIVQFALGECCKHRLAKKSSRSQVQGGRGHALAIAGCKFNQRSLLAYTAAVRCVPILGPGRVPGESKLETDVVVADAERVGDVHFLRVLQREPQLGPRMLPLPELPLRERDDAMPSVWSTFPTTTKSIAARVTLELQIKIN